MHKIVKDTMVKVIAGGHKGKIGKVTKVTGDQVWIEKVNLKERHIAPNRLNPRGGKKEIHLPIDISNVAVVIDEKDTTSKVGFKVSEKGKMKIAKKTGKEIK
jgi:large subunit ribosomal protein L24